MIGVLRIPFLFSISFLLYSRSYGEVEATLPFEGLWLEKNGNGGYLNMVPHPDGSDRAFFSNQQGKIWLATIPYGGCDGILDIIESNPFFDISDQILLDIQYGLMGMAFHPNFMQNAVSFSRSQRSGRWGLEILGGVVLIPKGLLTFFVETGQDLYEEVDIVKKGGNYGWRVYEGPFLFHPAKSPGGNTSTNSINQIFPVMGYTHSEMKQSAGSASITGGYFYRSMTDPCISGRYLFTDLYAGAIWICTEDPKNSGNFSTAKARFRCARDSPIRCDTEAANSIPDLGYVYSWAEDKDNNKDVLSSIKHWCL